MLFVSVQRELLQHWEYCPEHLTHMVYSATTSKNNFARNENQENSLKQTRIVSDYKEGEPFKHTPYENQKDYSGRRDQRTFQARNCNMNCGHELNLQAVLENHNQPEDREKEI